MADQPWWITIAAGVPTALIVAIGTWLSRRSDSSDKRADRDAQERDRVRSTMDERQTRWMDRQEKEIDRLHQQLEAVEDDRDRGWDFARAWREKTRDVKHACANARAIAEGLARRHGETLEPWRTSLDLPSLEEIERRPPDAPPF